MKPLLILLLMLTTSQHQQECQLLDNIFRDSRVINYLHTDLKERKTLYLINNDYCNLSENYGTFKILSVNEELAIENKNFIRIKSFSNIKGKKMLLLDYPIEGVVFEIHLDDKNCIKDVIIIET